MDGPPNQAVQRIPFGKSNVKIVTPPTGGGNTSSTTSGGAQSGTDATKTSGDSQSGTSTTSQTTPTFDPKGSVKPTDAQTVAEIKAYMDAHSIAYNASDTKQQLLDKVNA